VRTQTGATILHVTYQVSEAKKFADIILEQKMAEWPSSSFYASL
jgi:hypothetical protein